MSTTPNAMGVDEFAMRVVARSVPGAFFTLLTEEGEASLAALRLLEEIAALGEEKPVPLEPKDALDFSSGVRETPIGPLVVSNLDSFTEAEWAHLDLLRTRLEHDGAIVLVIGDRSFSRLMRAAPNFASFLGGSLWRWEQSSSLLSPAEREARLEALRSWSGKTDADVITLAQEKRLPCDPEFAEWLVLLNRGDLLER